MSQGRIWLGTIPIAVWLFPSPLPASVTYLKGQEERGASGYHHVQILVHFKRSVRLAAVRKVFPGHWEFARSDAANTYVWKEDTRVPDTQFELGVKPMQRNDSKDWDAVWLCAKRGEFDSIPADIRIRCYHQIKTIRSDNLQPTFILRTAFVYYGPTGTGKTRRAWEEAGVEAYAKDPRTKWWCGYHGQANVVIDEFRGAIDIAHLLRWLDRYPVIVETKGSAIAFSGEKIWITSNLHPQMWYPELDNATWLALERRLNIIELSYFTLPF